MRSCCKTHTRRSSADVRFWRERDRERGWKTQKPKLLNNETHLPLFRMSFLLFCLALEIFYRSRLSKGIRYRCTRIFIVDRPVSSAVFSCRSQAHNRRIVFLKPLHSDSGCAMGIFFAFSGRCFTCSDHCSSREDTGVAKVLHLNPK